jgi:hypothetical protein
MFLSSGCTSMDCFVWGVPQLDVNRSIKKTSDSLGKKIKELMDSLKRDTMAWACKQFRPRIEAMVAANVDFTE